MRIRKSASRLLGSTYSIPAARAPNVAHPFEALTPPLPMPFQAPCSAPESLVGRSSYASPVTASSGETCELSRSPWDLITELSISDPQVEDDLVDKYFVSVTCRASWLFTASSMPVASVRKKQAAGAGTVDADSATQPQHEAPRKAPKKLAVSKEKQREPMEEATVKKEEEQEVKQSSYMCKKNDGRRWYCRRSVSQPNSLCEYHLYQKRPYLNPEFVALAAEVKEAAVETKKVPQPPVISKPATTSKAATTSKSKPATASKSKPATTSKPRRKKTRHDFGTTEGFYYYAGFGLYCSKRYRTSTGINEIVPQQKQEEEDEPAGDAPAPDNKAALHEDESSCDDEDITGGDEESSDDDHYRLGVPGRSMNGNGKRKNGWKKRWRKPVKARSLKSLM